MGGGGVILIGNAHMQTISKSIFMTTEADLLQLAHSQLRIRKGVGGDSGGRREAEKLRVGVVVGNAE